MREAFGDLLREELFIEYNEPLKEVLAKEESPGARLKQLKIKNVPEGACAFQLDFAPSGELKKTHGKAFKQLSCLIKSDHGIANKKCDIVIAYPRDGRVHFLIADMKSDSPSKSSCKKQLRNSELFVQYLLSLLKEYHGVTGDFTITKAVFQTKRAILGKPVAQQKNKRKPKSDEGVFFVEVPLSGRNNSNGITSLNDFL